MSRRSQFFLSSILIILCFPVIGQVVGRLGDMPVALSIGIWAVASLVLFLYVLEKKYTFPEQLIFAIIPFLCVMLVATLGLQFNMFAVYPISALWVLYYAISVISMYFLFLALNIVNAATVRTVPLLKAAQTSILAISLLLAVAWALYVQYVLRSPIIAAWSWFIFSYLLSLAVIYLGQIEVVREFTAVVKVPLIESGIIALLQAYTVFITASWQMSVSIRVIYWVSSLATFTMIVRARRQRSLTRKFVRDFMLLQWIIFAAVLIIGLRAI